jgi:hypothetical protein
VPDFTAQRVAKLVQKMKIREFFSFVKEMFAGPIGKDWMLHFRHGLFSFGSHLFPLCSFFRKQKNLLWQMYFAFL